MFWRLSRGLAGKTIGFSQHRGGYSRLPNVRLAVGTAVTVRTFAHQRNCNKLKTEAVNIGRYAEGDYVAVTFAGVEHQHIGDFTQDAGGKRVRLVQAMSCS